MRTSLRTTLLSAAAGGALTLLGLLVGPAGAASADTVEVHLDATAGTMALPIKGGAQSVTTWGYCRRADAATPCGPVDAPGGPTIRVAVGDVVHLTLHNTLTETMSLSVNGQAMVPDLTGIGGGSSKEYTFTASRAGTYLYGAGLTPNSQHQVAMGLYGAFVVSPAAGQAYDADTGFDTDAVMVLSEVDPALNNAVDPAAFDMRAFSARWTLVNGRVHPAAAHVPATSGQKVLLRYVNAGVGYHSMAVLGAEQHIVGIDGSRLKNGAVDTSRHYVADTFGPGQTVDAIVTAPTTESDQKLAVYDASLSLHSSTAPGTAGMLTFIDVTGSGSTGDLAGPATTHVDWAAGTLTATVSDAATGGGNVAAAEYRLDSVSATATPMTGTFGGPTAAVTASVPVASGQHVLYVRGQDAAGNWGPWSSVLVTGADATGPTTSGMSLTPELGNGSADVTISATADDSASGNSDIAGATWTLDGGAAADMTLGVAGPVTALSATIPAATVAGLAEGPHTIAVKAKDSAGNEGAETTATLTIDLTAPAVTAVDATPNPNNGTMAVNASSPAVRLSATVTDQTSTVVRAEAYLDDVATAIPMEAADGAWSGSLENVYVDVPLATVRQLTDGNHSLAVRGMDAAGNWSPRVSTTLVVDKTAPALAGLAVAADGGTTVTLTGSVTDVTAVSRVEWFVGTDPGAGKASAATIGTDGAFSATIPMATYLKGDQIVRVRAIDGLGNRSAVNVVRPKLWFSLLGASTLPGVGSADVTDIFFRPDSGLGRAADLNARPYGIPAGANVDGFSRLDATHFYVSFTGNVTVGRVQMADEDVAYYNNGTWTRWFDGSARGLTNSGFDIDAVSVRGGRLYFSLNSTLVPPSAGGAGDTSDIYRWNGGTSYTRVVDASTVGIPAGANVDGFVWRSATDYYMSFAPDTTLAGMAVADEDVVHRVGTTWSVYFDGTAAGLTAAQDVDAFDIP
ncbi:multicopper oxidase domain-containing protein [Phycicoccus duodecadis]|uniref:Multicopper oxidase n=1 Tax=Phycicoccus duodecadis TaxID=173053 RepID=A0A2N3YH77_9MICO|nr:multicopper oxidase domain-containing protein [Phycicoccus duodecadis]PKW26215.1 multicopper oxidase [Phycicoccus duodecadis]